MRAILADLRFSIRNKWFGITILATIVCLWLDLGTDTYWLLHGGAMNITDLLIKALEGRGSALSLPLLSALPCAGNALRELSSGATRPAVFRSGRTAYIVGKVTAVLFVSILAQAVGVILFCVLLLVFCPLETFAFPVAMIKAWLLSTTIFAFIGGIGALIAKDTVCAYVIPTAMCFALTMLASRFFTDVKYLSPLSWLSGEGAIPLLCMLLAGITALYIAVLSIEVRRYV